MVNKPTDTVLYEKVKKDIYKKHKKHSAYRSGLLVKKYKQEFAKKYGDDAKPYGGKIKRTEGLRLWFLSKWRNQRGEVGYKKKGDIYRPTVKVNKKTPTTFDELSKKEIKRAMKEKKKTGRVVRFKKK